MAKWGQKEWIEEYWLRRMEDPFNEPHSIRQAFYRELPEITRFVPEEVQENPEWSGNFYTKMCGYLSHLVLDGRVSYERINVFDMSGASKEVWTGRQLTPLKIIGEVQTEYPIEVWVENDATFNSVAPLLDFHTGEYCLNLVSQRGRANTQEVEKVHLYRSHDVQVILNLTDFDPSGVDMPRDLQSRFRRIGASVEVIAVGIFPEQIPEERRGTSLIRYKQTDNNLARMLANWGHIDLVGQGYGFEIQALMPPEIRNLISNAIDETAERHGFERRDRREFIQEEEET